MSFKRLFFWSLGLVGLYFVYLEIGSFWDTLFGLWPLFNICYTAAIVAADVQGGYTEDHWKRCKALWWGYVFVFVLWLQFLDPEMKAQEAELARRMNEPVTDLSEQTISSVISNFDIITPKDQRVWLGDDSWFSWFGDEKVLPKLTWEELTDAQRQRVFRVLRESGRI